MIIKNITFSAILTILLCSGMTQPLICLATMANTQGVTYPKSIQADTSAKAALPEEEKAASFELNARAANESNWADGVFGPFTYGLTGKYTSRSDMELEAVFIRMHEPGMRTFDSFLDEGQLTLRLPPLDSLTFAATLWKNRMMDMYTNLGGIEINRPCGSYGIEGGVYGGTTSRLDVSGRFLGARIALSAEFGNLELSLEHVAGTIHLPNDPTTFGVGKYHHTSLEAGMNLTAYLHFPLRATLSLERRYFDFGSGGPVSEPIDTYIVVLGIEVTIFGGKD